MIASASLRFPALPSAARVRAVVVATLLLVVGLVLVAVSMPLCLVVRAVGHTIRPMRGVLRAIAASTVGRVFEVKFADRCAWRALYVYRRAQRGPESVTYKVFHIGIDPTDSRPNVFGGIGHDGPRTGRNATRLPVVYWSFRVRLPLISWRLVGASGYSRLVLWAYGRQQRVLGQWDGRRHATA
jgi:hypothetical protein